MDAGAGAIGTEFKTSPLSFKVLGGIISEIGRAHV